MHTVCYSLRGEPNTDRERDFPYIGDAVKFADGVIEDGGSAFVITPTPFSVDDVPYALCDIVLITDEIEIKF